MMTPEEWANHPTVTAALPYLRVQEGDPRQKNGARHRIPVSPECPTWIRELTHLCAGCGTRVIHPVRFSTWETGYFAVSCELDRLKHPEAGGPSCSRAKRNVGPVLDAVRARIKGQELQTQPELDL